MLPALIFAILQSLNDGCIPVIHKLKSMSFDSFLLNLLRIVFSVCLLLLVICKEAKIRKEVLINYALQQLQTRESLHKTLNMLYCYASYVKTKKKQQLQEEEEEKTNKQTRT